MPLVTNEGFEALSDAGYVAVDQIEGSNEPLLAVDVPNDTDPATLTPYFDKISLIAVDFPSFADGRGFSVAKRLRRLGYDGELRAKGHIIADQYAHALACGFDGVEIDDALAARQPFGQWQAAAAKVPPPYRAKVSAT